MAKDVHVENIGLDPFACNMLGLLFVNVACPLPRALGPSQDPEDSCRYAIRSRMSSTEGSLLISIRLRSLATLAVDSDLAGGSGPRTRRPASVLKDPH